MQMLGLHNRSRNRRVLFLLLLFAGSFAGAFAYAKVGAAFALLVSALGKAIVCGMLLFNKSDEKGEEHKVEEGLC